MTTRATKPAAEAAAKGQKYGEEDHLVHAIHGLDCEVWRNGMN